MWGKKREKEGTAHQQLSKRDVREMQKKNVDEIEKVSVIVCDEITSSQGYVECESLRLEFARFVFQKAVVIYSRFWRLYERGIATICRPANVVTGSLRLQHRACCVLV